MPPLTLVVACAAALAARRPMVVAPRPAPAANGVRALSGALVPRLSPLASGALVSPPSLTATSLVAPSDAPRRPAP
ncbi:MAG: hypothetical protein SF051_15395, partial [Elusimicrobiota bacterium]|nr:hypothetical protein [Elusimicrobiota bacterium]